MNDYNEYNAYENDDEYIQLTFPETLKETSKYQKKATTMLNNIETKKNNYKNVLPKNTRSIYNKQWNEITQIEDDLKHDTDEINNCIQKFEETKLQIKEINDVIQEIKAIINTKNVGTLEARTREVIRRYKINPNDLSSEAVLNQRYEEGGKSISKKNRKNRKNNKTKQKRRKLKETKVQQVYAL
jgi:hypothetical protein